MPMRQIYHLFPKKQKEESIKLSSFVVTRLGLEPKTPSLKGMCSTS